MTDFEIQDVWKLTERVVLSEHDLQIGTGLLPQLAMQETSAAVKPIKTEEFYMSNVKKTYLIIFCYCLPIVYQLCLQDFRNVKFHLGFFATVILKKRWTSGSQPTGMQTSSLPRFVPLASFLLLVVPSLLPSGPGPATPPPLPAPLPTPPDPCPVAPGMLCCRVFCIARFASVIFKRRLGGTHSSHLKRRWWWKRRWKAFGPTSASSLYSVRDNEDQRQASRCCCHQRPWPW